MAARPLGRDEAEATRRQGATGTTSTRGGRRGVAGAAVHAADGGGGASRVAGDAREDGQTGGAGLCEGHGGAGADEAERDDARHEEGGEAQRR
ncbi:hypothetical protein XA68_14414 [Ophiocordyceps unilateralis]|uniref:Uncharacterized protein n=1 Tax=Ophiocordyceps unilateralis TaxID=268505 RepID=A0A2A9P8V0_OPHUN|nr:hypothetical protein XA68_14414 [Ophiocordyceps unilateralis]